MTDRTGPPDALIIGAPKAGTSALHAALATHPQVFVPAVKEPKYFLCADAPPPAYTGPGDAHSNQEWVWRRADYEALFAPAPPDAVRIESTAFYLYSPHARRRIAEELPHARLIAVVRDPVDRAYSNWMHLWVDGLEPNADFLDACRQEERRIAAGWAPFWHYRRLGRYGEQLTDLLERVDRERVLVMRYRHLVDDPVAALNRVSRFLGIEEDRVATVPPDNSRAFVTPSLKTTVLGRVVRAGASLGRHAPPHVWRRASRPLLDALQAGGAPARPRLTVEQRDALIPAYADDIDRLEQVTDESFDDWRSAEEGGSYHDRRHGTGSSSAPDR